jgi:GNAT superfamily N-acetyltransferase
MESTPFVTTWVTDDSLHLDQARALFRTYAAELGVDLCFQGFEEELATLPGKYAPPNGGLLLAHNRQGAPLACAAFRPFEESICELKRFFVLPEARRLGLAGSLLGQILTAAKQAGYTRAYLDTLEVLQPAIAFYRKHGFHQIEAYYANPLPGVVYMARAL